MYAGAYNQILVFEEDTLYQSNKEGVFVLKYDENDQLIWSNFYDEYTFHSMIVDQEDNIVLATTKHESHQDFRTYITKLDTHGDLIWSNTYGDSAPIYYSEQISLHTNQFNDIVFTFNKSVVLRDEYNQVLADLGGIHIITALNAQGDSLYTNMGINEYKEDIFDHNGNYSFTLDRYDLDSIYSCYALVFDDLGNYYVVGEVYGIEDMSYLYNRYYSRYITKYSNTGQKLWSKPLNLSLNHFTYLFELKLKIDSFGNIIIITGIERGEYTFGDYTLNVESDIEGLYLKLNQEGDVLYASLDSSLEDYPVNYMNDYLNVGDNHYITSVHIATNSFITHIKGYHQNNLFEQGWEIRGSSSSVMNNLRYYNNKLYVTGFVIHNDFFSIGDHNIQFNRNNGAFLLKIDLDYVTETTQSYISSDQISVYPNPVTNELIIALDTKVGDEVLSIMDISGKEVYQTSIRDNVSSHYVADLIDGVYFVQMISSEYVNTIKLLKTSVK